MRFALRSLFLVVALLLGLATVAMAVPSVAIFYNPLSGHDSLLVTGDGSTLYDNIEIPCQDKDVVTDFTTPTANWAVDAVSVIGGRKHVVLKRTPATSASETVLVYGPTHRGGIHLSQLTSGTTTLLNKSGPTFLIIGAVPAIGPWGLALLALLMLGAGAVYLNRSRARTNEA